MFQVIALEGCPYSQRAVEILKSLPNTEVIWVDHESKHRYKTPDRQTFPQITYKYKQKNGQLKTVFIGGLSELEKLIELKKKQ
jgi:hypothetical protein